MDKTGRATHCFGRFLTDLPPGAVINAGYYLWGNNIQRLDGTPAELTTRIAHHERELRNGIHKKIRESMFVQRAEGKAGAISLWPQDSNASLLPYRVDPYFMTYPKREVFLYSREVTRDKGKGGEEAINNISRSLRSRGPKEAPIEPGFYIDHAYIAGGSFQDEEFGVGATFPNHPGVRFEFRSSTRPELNSLLERIDGFVQNMLATVAGVGGLRKGKHLVGSLPRGECLVAGNNKEQRAYTFVWEVRGKEESLTKLNLAAGLAVLEHSSGNGRPLPPVFKSDKEALEPWDAIVDSIRMRLTSSSPRGGNAGLSPAPKPATLGDRTLGDDYVYEESLSNLEPKDNWLDNLQKQPATDAIRLGDTASHRGTVVEAFGQTDLNSKPMAGAGHQVVCSLYKGTFPITEGSALLSVNEIPVALHGMKTTCGANLVASGPLGAAEN